MIASLPRLAVAWITVALFWFLGPGWLGNLGAPLPALGLFAWLLAVIVWAAFGVVHEAEEIAHRLGEPLGTLILTLSIVIIEVALISAVMLGPKEAATLGRDTMFAVLMIVLNGVVGLALLWGGLRHHQQSYNLQGASAYLAVILPLTLVALVLPNFTTSTSDGTLTTVQAVFFSVFTLALYVIFLVLQTGRHSGFFTVPEDAVPDLPAASSSPGKDVRVTDGPGQAAGRTTPAPLLKTGRDDNGRAAPGSEMAPAHVPEGGSTALHVVLLLANILPIVILSKSLATVLDFGIAALNAPTALGGVLIAMIVFTPEGISAFRAVVANQLQRGINLCLGAAASTLGLTVPAVLAIGLLTGRTVVLGLAPSEMLLLALTLALSMVTFSNRRTTMLEGAVHLMVFLVFLVLIFSP